MPKANFDRLYFYLNLNDSVKTPNGEIMSLSAKLPCVICGQPSRWIALGTLTMPHVCSEACLIEYKRDEFKSIIGD